VAPQPQPGVVTVAPVSGGPPQSSGSPLADTVRSTVEQFVQQLRAVSGAGGSVAADPIVLSLYQTLNALHPQLLKQIDDIQQRKVHQEKVLHKINEAKTARAALNTMRREHQERICQQEEEQSLLARMQMEQKLALLRQQKQEQLMYQQSLQQKRLDGMQAKRQEYERQLALQRDQERQQLIAQEQQVLQRQLHGSSPVHMQIQVGPQPVVIPQFQPVAPPPPSLEPPGAVGLPLQSLALHDPTVSAQAPPLPSKLDHNLSADPRPLSLPPPYHPVHPTGPAFQTLPTIPQYAVYSDPSHAPPPGSHGDSSLWVNNSTPSLHPPAHLHPSPTTTPPQQRSPMTAPVQPLGSMQQSMGVAVGGAYPAHFQQMPGPSHQLTSLPPQQQLYQPSAAMQPPPLDHVPTHTMLNQQQPLPGQQPMSMQQLLTMQGMAMAPPPPGGVQRQESGPPLISFD
jgi:growth factor-regulated tyrosine kinase substrate